VKTALSVRSSSGFERTTFSTPSRRGADAGAIRAGDGGKMRTDGQTGILSLLRKFFRAAGLIDDSVTGARALSRLEDELFRLPFVEGVVVQGFTRSPDGRLFSDEILVQVVTSAAPDELMRHAIEAAVHRMNRRSGLKMVAVPCGPEMPVSGPFLGLPGSHGT
jgi:hypothetical protein